MNKFRAIDIRVPAEAWKKIGWLRGLWGLDIWINDVPVVKALVVANIVIWMLMWRALR